MACGLLPPPPWTCEPPFTARRRSARSAGRQQARAARREQPLDRGALPVIHRFLFPRAWLKLQVLWREAQCTGKAHTHEGLDRIRGNRTDPKWQNAEGSLMILHSCPQIGGLWRLLVGVLAALKPFPQTRGASCHVLAVFSCSVAATSTSDALAILCRLEPVVEVQPQ